MEGTGPFVAGDVVIIAFPFTDLSDVKSRPALVLGKSDYEGDYILCEITSKNYDGRLAIALTDAQFESGGLPLSSYVRPLVLFTLEEALIKKSIGRVNKLFLQRVLDGLIEGLRVQAE